MCATNLEVLDTTLGMQELEDAVAEDQWHSSEAYENSVILHSVEIEGVTMKKSHAISQKFRYAASASSTDWLHHVTQESRFKSTGGLAVPYSQTGDASINESILSLLQPIATVVACEGKVFLCIAKVNGLFHDYQPVDTVPLSILSGKGIHVLYQGFCLILASHSDDSDGKHDWRSKDLFRHSAKVPGALVLPINPDLTSHKLCNAHFLFQSSELMQFATTLSDSVCHSHCKAIPQVSPSDHFPYREQDGECSYFQNRKVLKSTRESLFCDRAH